MYKKVVSCIFASQGESVNNYEYDDVGDGDNLWWRDSISDVSFAVRRVFSLLVRSAVFSQRCMELAKISSFLFGYFPCLSVVLCSHNGVWSSPRSLPFCLVI